MITWGKASWHGDRCDNDHFLDMLTSVLRERYADQLQVGLLTGMRFNHADHV